MTTLSCGLPARGSGHGCSCVPAVQAEVAAGCLTADSDRVGDATCTRRDVRVPHTGVADAPPRGARSAVSARDAAQQPIIRRNRGAGTGAPVVLAARGRCRRRRAPCVAGTTPSAIRLS